jgi:hypothetical protein
VSHIPLRKEKDCLNCGTIVQGPYCHNCGQENIVPREGFLHMVKHFFYDITHFDSNFFHTVHHLLLRPGFLSKEYSVGRRARYLHPVKMYVFTSAVFFLLFFSILSVEPSIKSGLDTPVSQQDRKAYIDRLERKLKKSPGDTLLIAGLARARDTNVTLTLKDFVDTTSKKLIFNFSGKNYKSRREYDSIQRLLPAKKKDSWLARRFVYRAIQVNEKYSSNPEEGLRKFLDSALHRLPYLLFISLPLFALILKLVYIRRKQFYFSDHAVFTLHLYIFDFVALMVIIGIDKLRQLTHAGFLDWVITILVLVMIFYLYKAMRNYYGQRRGKTFAKFLLVSFLSFVMMIALVAFFALFTAVTF